MRLKRHAVFRHLAQGREAEDLVAATIGEDRAGPSHKAMQAPHRFDRAVPRPEV